MRIAFVVLLVIHGAIHLLGFAKAFRLAEINQLAQPIGRALGSVWLLAALLMFATAAAFYASPKHWWLVGCVALLVSQIVIVTSWRDAKFGTLPNVILLVPLVLSLLDLRSTSFRSIYDADVEHQLARLERETSSRALSSARVEPADIVTEADVAKLPPLVRTYLARTGAVGQPRVYDVRTHWRAEMKSSPDAPWMAAHAVQHDFFGDEPARLFLMDASRSGVPFVALHRYIGAEATMQVRVASLVNVVDARGPQMNRSETVTLFNDICFFAPAALIDVNVVWEPVDAHSVRGTFTNAGNTISAVLTFDAAGDLVDFVSGDRLMSADGKTYESFPWSTPIRDYKTFGATRIASYGEAIWKQPGGDFVYGRFTLEAIEINVGRARSSAPRVTKRAAASPALVPHATSGT